jgi:transposase InsO family protein
MAFGSRLKRAEIIQSVGKPASCWDNIVAECRRHVNTDPGVASEN